MGELTTTYSNGVYSSIEQCNSQFEMKGFSSTGNFITNIKGAAGNKDVGYAFTGEKDCQIVTGGFDAEATLYVIY